jgi:hypothetical protein
VAARSRRRLRSRRRGPCRSPSRASTWWYSTSTASSPKPLTRPARARPACRSHPDRAVGRLDDVMRVVIGDRPGARLLVLDCCFCPSAAAVGSRRRGAVVHQRGPSPHQQLPGTTTGETAVQWTSARTDYSAVLDAEFLAAVKPWSCVTPRAGSSGACCCPTCLALPTGTTASRHTPVTSPTASCSRRPGRCICLPDWSPCSRWSWSRSALSRSPVCRDWLDGAIPTVCGTRRGRTRSIRSVVTTAVASRDARFVFGSSSEYQLEMTFDVHVCGSG